jgi:hypothetical protein
MALTTYRNHLFFNVLELLAGEFFDPSNTPLPETDLSCWEFPHMFLTNCRDLKMSSPVNIISIEPEDQLTFVLFGENVFVVDYVLARVNSFAGVKSADAYILTKLQYYDDWIMKEINKRLLLRPVLHRSR